MSEMTKPNPVTPYLSVRNGIEAISFYEQAFGAEEAERYEFEGKLGHAALRSGLVDGTPLHLAALAKFPTGLFAEHFPRFALRQETEVSCLADVLSVSTAQSL